MEQKQQGTTVDPQAFWAAVFAPPPGQINLRGPNLAVTLLFVAAFIVSQIDERPVYFGIVPHDTMLALLSGFAGIAVNRVTQFFACRIGEFQPASLLQAKRANEQIKSVANLVNALAGGSAIALTVKQLSEVTPDYALITIALGVAVWVHAGARNLLGLLKDDDPATYRDGKITGPT